MMIMNMIGNWKYTMIIGNRFILEILNYIGMKCENCNSDLFKTPYKYEGKDLYECSKCEEEYA